MTARWGASASVAAERSAAPSCGASFTGASAPFFRLATLYQPLAQERVIDEPAEADVDAAEGGAEDYRDDDHHHGEVDRLLAAWPDHLSKLADDIHDEARSPARDRGESGAAGAGGGAGGAGARQDARRLATALRLLGRRVTPQSAAHRASRCWRWPRQRGQNFRSSIRSGSLRRFFVVT